MAKATDLSDSISGRGACRNPKTFFFLVFFIFVGVGAPWGRHLPQALRQVVTALVQRGVVGRLVHDDGQSDGSSVNKVKYDSASFAA